MLLHGLADPQPGVTLFVLHFICIDLVDVFQSRTDIVQAFEQIFLAKWVDLESEIITTGCFHLLVFQIHSKLDTLISADFLHQISQSGLVDDNRQYTVLKQLL